MAELILLKFDNVYGAQSALASVRALENLKYAWVDDVAVLEKHKHGLVSLHTPHGSVTGGAWAGALVGMLVLWWFPPAWFALGAVGGAAIGAGVGEMFKHAGIDEKLMDEVKAKLTNGTSALVLIGIEGDVDEMSRAFEANRPVEVVGRPLPHEAVESLRKKLDAEL